MKWTTYTISALVGIAIVVSGCLTQRAASHKQPAPPTPIQFQRTMELARKKPFKNPLLFRSSRKRIQLKTFAATAPSLNFVLEWKVPTNALGIPVVYQVLCDTNVLMFNPVELAQTQGLSITNQFDLVASQKFFKVQTLAAVTPYVVTLSWDPAAAPDLSGYKLYYGNASRSYSNSIDIGAHISCSLTNLAPGTYYTAITCYTTNGLESDFSGEQPITITPVPPTEVPGLIAHR